MLYFQDLCTYNTYTGGKDTPEEMILAAIEKGLDSIGILVYAYDEKSIVGDKDIAEDVLKARREEIGALKEKYYEKIKVYCGREVDTFSPGPFSSPADYDFLVGKVHFLACGDDIVNIECSEEELTKIINTYFGGDKGAFLKAFFAQIDKKASTLGAHRFFGQLGYLVKNGLLDGNEDVVKGGLDKIKKAYTFIGLGAVRMADSSFAYPAEYVLEEIKRIFDGNYFFASGCDAKEDLFQCYDVMEAALKKAGFVSHYVLTICGIVPVTFDSYNP